MLLAGYELPDNFLTPMDKAVLERINSIQNALLHADADGTVFVDKPNFEAYLHATGLTITAISERLNLDAPDIRPATEFDTPIDYYSGMVETRVLEKSLVSPFSILNNGRTEPEQAWTRYVAENMRGQVPSLREIHQLAQAMNDPMLSRSFEEKAAACFKQIGWAWLFWFCLSLVVGIILIVLSGGTVAAILALLLAAGLGASILTALTLFICLVDALLGPA